MKDPTRSSNFDLLDWNIQFDGSPIPNFLRSVGNDLTRSVERLSFPRDDVIFTEGDPSDRLFIIQSGKVTIGRTTSRGRRTLLAILGPSDMFGYVSIFDPSPRSSTATAITEVATVALPWSTVRHWVASRPVVAEQLLQSLAREQRQADAMLTDRQVAEAKVRVAKTLLQLARRFGVPSPSGGVQVRHDLTQQELGELVGVRRETINEILGQFVRRGWIRLGTHGLVILDPAQLARRTARS